jgi:hypothetical protein
MDEEVSDGLCDERQARRRLATVRARERSLRAAANFSAKAVTWVPWLTQARQPVGEAVVSRVSATSPSIECGERSTIGQMA